MTMNTMQSNGKTQDSQWREEITLLKKLNHPNIVRLYGVHNYGTELYMVLEYVSGGSLNKYLAENQGEYHTLMFTFL